MDAHTFVDALGRELSIDLCKPCQSFWFDGHESLQLSPGATLSLFRLIGEHVARPEIREGDVAKVSALRGASAAYPMTFSGRRALSTSSARTSTGG